MKQSATKINEAMKIVALISILFISVSCQQSAVGIYVDTDRSSSESDKEEIAVSGLGDRPQVILSYKSDNNYTTIDMDFTKKENGNVAPRVAEIYVEYSSNLKFISSTEGNAVKDADKELVVQNLESEHKLRLVIFAAGNVNELNTGRLSTLSFTRSGEKEATVRILTDTPIFAPDEANEGLLVSDPITF